ncbi:MAG: glycoside hydrolase family 5 protein [Chloroflexi bacterium]|nr:glycoside hydrolase family 5 protein [Chloroflexota bacterium]
MFAGAANANLTVWDSQEAQDAWAEMWRLTAERYGQSAVVAGYDLLTEPTVNRLIDPSGERSPQEVAAAAGTTRDWNRFAATPIIVDSMNWASAAWFLALTVFDDPNIVYGLHTYDPDLYTQQEAGQGAISYPSVVDYAGERVQFDSAWLRENLEPVRTFQQTHNVPVFVGEFGTLRWVPGSERYFNGFDVELGADVDQARQSAAGCLSGCLVAQYRLSEPLRLTPPRCSGAACLQSPW